MKFDDDEILLAAGGGRDPDGRVYFRTEVGKKNYAPLSLKAIFIGFVILSLAISLARYVGGESSLDFDNLIGSAVGSGVLAGIVFIFVTHHADIYLQGEARYKKMAGQKQDALALQRRSGGDAQQFGAGRMATPDELKKAGFVEE